MGFFTENKTILTWTILTVKLHVYLHLLFCGIWSKERLLFFTSK